MTPLSAAVTARVEKQYPPFMRGKVSALLETRCGENLPLMADCTPDRCDRVRFAVLKLSRGNFVRLVAEVEAANIDWRDTLMAAGFGSDIRSHEIWWP